VAAVVGRPRDVGEHLRVEKLEGVVIHPGAVQN
jgi:hypothetical protein